MKRAGKITFALGGIIVAASVAVPFIASLSSYSIGVVLGTFSTMALLLATGMLRVKPKAPPVIEWHVFDEELPAELFSTEKAMQAKGRQVMWPGWCSHGDTYDHGTVVYRNGTEVAP